MSTAHDGFADNWSYLRTELGWLDQVLLAAVARQRKQTKEIDRIAQNRADRVTSHWWKGIVSLEGHPSYDEHRKPSTPAAPKVGFHQQLELRIQSSQKKGVVLGLPLLRDRLRLTPFEKNVILVGLAPEINRRYARLYRYLKGDDDLPDSDLPSVDLVLRLLCRNDQEWSIARKSFAADAALVQKGVVELYACTPDTRLKSTLRLADPCVEFLLSTSPSKEELENILNPIRGYLLPPPNAKPAGISQAKTPTQWDDLIVPKEPLETLQFICQRVQGQLTVDRDWGFAQVPGTAEQQGTIVWLNGASGVGKTLAARAIAHTLDHPLTILDLNQVDRADVASVLDYLKAQSPVVLLVKSAEHWFGRNAKLSTATLHQWLTQRQHKPCITILATAKPETIAQHWKSTLSPSITLPMPIERHRLQLWQRAFPTAVPMAQELPWRWLAKSFTIPGGEILAIARDAALYAAAQQESVEMAHLLQAITQRGHSIPSPPPKARRSRRRTESAS